MSDLYQRRGVSAQKEEVHAAIRHLDKGLFPNAFCKILPDGWTGDPAYCCIMHNDTAGTKSILAYLYWKETGDLDVWKGIAQDALVMNIDDMICSGVTSGFMISSTIARNKHLISGDVLRAVIGGCEDLFQEWNQLGLDIRSAGGETADVGDLVRTIDVGYTAFARMRRDEVITIQPKAGDVIIGLASYGQATYEKTWNSGIGCNGLTSARHDMLNATYKSYRESFDPGLSDDVVYLGAYRLQDQSPEGRPIAQLLLSPTRTFAPVLKPMIEQYRPYIHGIVHNTGGGQTKCLKYIDEPVRLIKDKLFPLPEVFRLIQQASGADYREMYQVFNMGHRMELYVPASEAQGLLDIANNMGVEARVIGRVENAAQKEVLIESPYGSFSYLG